MPRRQLYLSSKIFLTPNFEDDNAFYALIRDFVFNLPGYQPQAWSGDCFKGKRLSLIELRARVNQGLSEVHWERKSSPAGAGSFSKRLAMPTGLEHAKHQFGIAVANDEQMEWVVSYLCYSASSDGVDFACCDAVSISNATTARNHSRRIGHPYSTHTLRRALPDLSWGHIFGRPYVKIFGMDRLLSSPAYRVEQLTPDAVYLQLTESVFDILDRPAEVHARKQLVKRHLDENAFVDAARPASHIYRTPAFEF